MVALLFGVAGLILSGTPQQTVVYGQGDADEVFPFDSLSDWASYAHQLSVVTVVAESELPPPDPPESHGGYVGRSVVLRIDETIWTAPGEEAVSGEVDSVVWGWMLRGAALRPVNFGSGPRLEVGNRYLIALVPFEDGDWGQMTGSSVLPLEGDRIPEDFRTVHPVASQLVGLTTAEIVEMLDAAPPDPIADSLRHLDPVQRVRTVIETRRDAIESGEPWSLPDVSTAGPSSS